MNIIVEWFYQKLIGSDVSNQTRDVFIHSNKLFDNKPKVIDPKYYMHLNKGARTKAIWADKKWVGFWQISLYIK